MTDPYHAGLNAAGVSQFDSIMNLLQVAQANVVIHLGPGTFVTKGFIDNVGGWQIRAGMKILGSGVDVTILQVDNSTVATGAHVFAISHPVKTGGQAGTQVDAAEVSDLTVDCGSGATGAAAGAIRLLGNNARVRRVKIQKWGTNSTSVRGFGIVCLTGDPANGSFGVDNTGIEDCYAVEPAAGVTNSIATAFSVGDWTYAAPSGREPEGKSPFIRNCYVDGAKPGANPGDAPYAFVPTTAIPSGSVAANRSLSTLVALSFCWCRGGVAEGNQIYNVDVGGPYQTSKSIRDGIVRNNFYKNVAFGPYFDLGQVSSTNLIQGGSPSTSLSWSGSYGTVGTSGSLLDLSTLRIGERVAIVAGGGFTGTYVVQSVSPSSSPPTFQVLTPNPSPSATTVTSVARIFGLGRVILEGNILELPGFGVVGTAVPIGFQVLDNQSSAQPPDSNNGDVIVRGNKIRLVDGIAPTSSDKAYGGEVRGAKNLQVQNTVIDLFLTAFPTLPQPMQNVRCGSATYLNNRTSAGTLVQGVNEASPPRKYDELETLTEDAFVLAFAES